MLVRTPWFGVYLHIIRRPDWARCQHDHPWPFVTVILRGGYEEQVGAETFVRRPGYVGLSAEQLRASDYPPAEQRRLSRSSSAAGITRRGVYFCHETLPWIVRNPLKHDSADVCARSRSEAGEHAHQVDDLAGPDLLSCGATAADGDLCRAFDGTILCFDAYACRRRADALPPVAAALESQR